MGRIIAIIGGGGKTTSMCAVAKHLEKSSVHMTTTTHIFPVYPPESRVLLLDPSKRQLLDALSQPGIVCAGVPDKQSKIRRLCSFSPDLLSCAADCADWVIYEADRANRRPLKLHQTTEPVIPKNTGLCLIVVGLSALGRPVSETIHRYHLNPLSAAGSSPCRRHTGKQHTGQYTRHRRPSGCYMPAAAGHCPCSPA